VRAWLEWKRDREKRGEADEQADGPLAPACSIRYLVLEAAREFGCDGLRGFLTQPLEWQAEMVAHLVIRMQREGYMVWKAKEWEKRKGKKFVDPGAAQNRKWGVEGGQKWRV
jgi:hypothetical protein